jgi:transposase-like protein
MARTKTNKGSGYNRHKLHYDSDFKWRVCQEYLNGNDTKLAVQLRNGIKGKTTIVVWLRQFGLKDKVKSLTLSEQLSLQMPQPKPEKVQFQETELDKLKKELSDANLRADAYQKMIEIAEQEFKIDIRKKHVAKQSTLSKKLDLK